MIDEILIPEIKEEEPKNEEEMTYLEKLRAGTAGIKKYQSGLTPEQRKENSRRAQAASVAKRKNEANMQKAILKYFSANLSKKEEEARAELEELGLDVSQLNAMVAGIGKAAKKGNPKAFDVLGTYAGQKPESKSVVSITERQMDADEIRAFFGVLNDDEDGEE